MCDILVVDDDELVRSTLSSILEMEGWCIREAGSPDEATVVTENASDGGLDTHRFDSTSARYVRITGTERATQWGISIQEAGVFSK